MGIDGHIQRQKPMLVADLGKHDMIIGRLWFAEHDVLPDCRRRRLIWPHEVSLFEEVASKIALPTPITILKNPRNVTHQMDADRRDKILEQSIDPYLDRNGRRFPSSRHHQKGSWQAKAIDQMRRNLDGTCPSPPLDSPELSGAFDINMISASGYQRLETRSLSDPKTEVFATSLKELQKAKKYILTNLDKGFIVPSSAPYASPILMARKPGGGLRFCVDYPRLNALTKKNCYPLPLIDEVLQRTSKAELFTKVDIQQGFHRIRMAPDAEDLTTFRTRYGSFKYKVLPFGLTNGPATFQRFMNDVLRECMDEYAIAFVDDVLIYSENEEDHRRHVREVLLRLRAAGLQVGIKNKCEEAFQELKKALLSAPILRHYDRQRLTQVETDASDGVLGAVLTQYYEEDDFWHPVAFYSKGMQQAELHYEVRDKELLAIVRALQEWRPELLSLAQTERFGILTDHQSLEYFMKNRQLNQRQMRWSEFLSQFHFMIKYRPGKKNIIADVLSRKDAPCLDDSRQAVLLPEPCFESPGRDPGADPVQISPLSSDMTDDGPDGSSTVDGSSKPIATTRVSTSSEKWLAQAAQAGR
ncbi:retrovirus polyprotein [Penicillium bovifimosum]|uniref:Retrovirus polyprotein n=1 Tax=Penicillium bovifimosum TaxID=126998 RepID=A0A9W9L428_9EURO|nr:retrovirus polyprotein [Penicillium bovifimosum]KAJ5135347.1 retrovirus polyprotein [Penicillium bovifimosum]